ncbi:hypothetical protein ACJX0J_016490, partial [Zea mays]
IISRKVQPMGGGGGFIAVKIILTAHPTDEANKKRYHTELLLHRQIYKKNYSYINTRHFPMFQIVRKKKVHQLQQNSFVIYILF